MCPILFYPAKRLHKRVLMLNSLTALMPGFLELSPNDKLTLILNPLDSQRKIVSQFLKSAQEIRDTFKECS